MSRCVACDRLLTGSDMHVSYDYCGRCLKVVSDDLQEFEQIKLLNELNDKLKREQL